MKKLLLIASMSISVASQAQTYGISLTSPNSGTTITHQQPTTYSFFVKNVSSSQLDSGTAYGIGFGTVNQQGNYVPFGSQIVSNPLPQALPAGDSVQRSETFTLSMPPSTNQNSVICVAVYTISGNQGTFQAASCRIYNLFNTVNDIKLAANSVNVYPNPANQQLSFKIDYNKPYSIHMYDITGKLVYENNTEAQLTTISVSDFKKGFYIYEIRTAEGTLIKNGKVTINH